MEGRTRNHWRPRSNCKYILGLPTLSKCCAYGSRTALPAVFSTLAMGITCIVAPVAAVESYGTYNYNNGDYYYDKSGANIATEAFALLVMILVGPLYLAIMLLCCVSFGRKRAIFKVTMILCFLVAALLVFMLVR